MKTNQTKLKTSCHSVSLPVLSPLTTPPPLLCTPLSGIPHRVVHYSDMCMSTGLACFEYFSEHNAEILLLRLLPLLLSPSLSSSLSRFPFLLLFFPLYSLHITFVSINCSATIVASNFIYSLLVTRQFVFVEYQTMF